MHDFYRRFLGFSLLGMLAMGSWAMLFGAFTGVAAYLFVAVVSPNYHNSFASIVWVALSTMASIALPLGFVLFSGAFFLTPQPKNGLRQLIRLCLIRSLMGAFLLALVSVSISAKSSSNFIKSADGSTPPYFVNLIAGWALGYFFGIFWGLIEGIIRLRKADQLTKLPLATSPIAHP